MKKITCLICARGGSKGLKNKNIKKFHGKPLIEWTFKIAKSINKFSNIILSTDSQKIAKIAKSNSINSFVYVSSGFADPKSSGVYLKNKGDVEQELKSLNFLKLGIMRPSFLIGDRNEKRIGEKIGIFFFKLISPFFFGPFKKMKPIHSEKVAKAMIKIANENLGKTILESNEIVEISSG